MVGENEQIMGRLIHYDFVHVLQLQKLNLGKNVSLATSQQTNIQNGSWEWNKLLKLKLLKLKLLKHEFNIQTKYILPTDRNQIFEIGLLSHNMQGSIKMKKKKT